MVIVSSYVVLQGTEINAEVKHGRNALHYAADAGKVPIVRFLLENMAIIDVRILTCFKYPVNLLMPKGSRRLLNDLRKNEARACR